MPDRSGKKISKLGLVPPARSGARQAPPRFSRAPRPAREAAGAVGAAGEGAKTAGGKAAATKRTVVPPRPRPRFKLTRRATILVLALCAVVVTVAYPLQEYLSQSSQLDAVDRQNAALSRQVASLQAQIALWNDPGYLQIQARARLHYVKPGEEGFTVPGPANGTEQLGLPTPTATPWYDKVWNSVRSPSPQGTGTGG